MKLLPKGRHITCFKYGDKLQRLNSVRRKSGFIDNSYNLIKGRKSYIILKEIIKEEGIFFKNIS